MTIWLLVAMSALTGLGVVVVTARNRAAQAEVNAVFRKYGLRGAPLVVLIALIPVVNAALWTVYAFQVHDWRYAAIPWLPILCSWLARMASHEIKPGSGLLR